MSLVADAPGELRPRRSILLSPEMGKIAIGIILILLTLYGQQIYGMATSAWRLDSSLRGLTGPSNVIVVLDFQPERFHSERIQQYGAFAGRDGGLNRIRLRNVRPARLRELAAIPWVARIEPMK
jgi:hypothetical protein